MIEDREYSSEIKGNNQIGRGRGSFISKLLEIMKIYPDIIHWTEDGTRIKIEDVKEMEKKIIPTYYRHRNIHSFVRQLNMYYFCKFETQNKNEMLFQNDIFRKGNEDNFYLIQRRNKGRDQLIHKMEDRFKMPLKRIKEHQHLTTEAKDLMTASIEFQQITLKNLEKIKNNISALSQNMKNSRSKDIKETIEKLKTPNTKINQLISVGKNMQQYIKNNLCVDIPLYRPTCFSSYHEKPQKECIISYGFVPPSEISIFRGFAKERQEQNQISFEQDGFDEDVSFMPNEEKDSL